MAKYKGDWLRRMCLISSVATVAAPRGLIQTWESGMVEPDGNYRFYRVPQCGRSYSLAELQPVFAAHSVEWSIMGRDMPWWSVLTEDKYKREKPTRKVIASFYESGKLHVERVLADVGIEGALAEKSVLDLGCGVGRLALDFARRGASVACVDQSVHHLALARHQMPKQALSSEQLARIHYLVNGPDLIASVGGRRFDLIHSVIVLQHAVAPIQAARARFNKGVEARTHDLAANAS